MAKPDKTATTAATEPTIAPPPPVVTEEEETPATQPEAVNYPAGVSMHQAGELPNTRDREARIVRDPKSPPPGWKGTFNRCGGCGDFLGNSDRCPTCSPAVVQPNVFNVARGA